MYNPHIWSMHSPGNSHALPQGRARVERYRAAAGRRGARRATRRRWRWRVPRAKQRKKNPGMVNRTSDLT